MKPPPLPLIGCCQCGRVRYAITATPDALAYETQPPDVYAALKARWQEMIAAG